MTLPPTSQETRSEESSQQEQGERARPPQATQHPPHQSEANDATPLQQNTRQAAPASSPKQTSRTPKKTKPSSRAPQRATKQKKRKSNAAGRTKTRKKLGFKAPILMLGALCMQFFRFLGLCLKIKLNYWRNHPFHGLLNIILIGVLAILLDTGTNFYQQLIYEPVPQYTINSVVKASKFTRNFNADKADRSAKKEFLQAGAPRWAQRESVNAVLHEARQAGLSIEHQAILLAIVEIESGFNPMARAHTSSACGLFQFIKATGERYGLSRENCMDPVMNTKAGIKHYLDNYNRRIEKKVGNLPTVEKLVKTFELSYYLHHDGPQSADHSDRLKAIILEGTPFLLRAHAILEEERKRTSAQPSFMQKFMERSEELLLGVAEKLKNLTTTEHTETAPIKPTGTSKDANPTKPPQ